MNKWVNLIVNTFQLRALSRIRQYLTVEASPILIHAFISRRLVYEHSPLCGLPDTDTQKLQKIETTTARILTKPMQYDHISPVQRDLHWLYSKTKYTF